jgi:iron complex outermembrane receptor protein
MFKPTLMTLLLLSSASVASAQSIPENLEAVEDEIIQDEIIVTGRAQRLYRVGETTSGKLSTDPLNSTQIITSINEQLIEDQGARDAKDIYRNIAGVSVFSYAGVTARGFRQEEIFFDGLRGDPYVGFSVPQLFNVERVEFLKGPAGMLYGQGAPGGLFNYVTKKPERDFSAELRAIVGTEGRYGGSYEITGPMGDILASRLGVFYETRNTSRINSGSETFILDGGLSVQLPNDAELILQGTRYEQNLDGNRLRGVPVDDDGNFLTDRRWNHNEDTDFLNLDSTNYQARLTGQTGEELNWDVTLRYTESRQEQNYHEPRALIDSNGDGAIDLVAREFRDQLREEEQISFGANLTWSRDFGRAQNRLLVGYEYFDSENTANLGGTALSANFVTRFLTGQSQPGDIIPLYLDGSNYGQTNSGAYDVQFRPEQVSGQSLHGLYGLNEITVGRFTAVGGLRYDDNSAGDDDNVSFRVGGIYKPQENISLFLQYADSYSPISNEENVESIGGAV